MESAAVEMEDDIVAGVVKDEVSVVTVYVVLIP